MQQELLSLKVSGNKRFLVREDGSSFFWLGDTAWELFHKLNREEAEMFLRNRSERKFNVIQAVALAELEGITVPNAYGRLPLKLNENGVYDPELPDVEEGVYDYWDHVDYIIDTAASLGIYIALLPTWGDKYNILRGKGPIVFNESNAKTFGWWLGERYKECKNLIWVLGGDRPLTQTEHFHVNRELAEGIRQGDGGKHLITFHPPGGFSSSHHVHNEEWLDFNMIQSGHRLGERDNYVLVREDYEKYPVKPTIDGEPCYEDHPRGFKAENGYFDDADVRVAAYYAVFSGSFGHTYGHHSVWCMSPGQHSSLEFSEPGGYVIMSWQEAILRPGAAQMQHVQTLMESRPFLERIPDQELLAVNYSGSNQMVATRGLNYAMLYTPNGLKIQVVMGKISGSRVKALWYDPRLGQFTEAGQHDNQGIIEFTPPSSGRGNDWVLVLDSFS